MPSSAAISDLFPLMQSNFTFSRSSPRISLRNSEAPAPTGSSTTGIPISFALLPAISMAASFFSLGIPMFIISASHRDTISATSLGESAHIAAPPDASTKFTVSFMVTLFVII